MRVGIVWTNRCFMSSSRPVSEVDDSMASPLEPGSGSVGAGWAGKNTSEPRSSGSILILHGRARDCVEQPDQVLFKIGQTAPALRQELRGAEPKAGLIGVSDIQRRVDQQGD